MVVFPPHLIAPLMLLMLVAWLMLVRQFQRSASIQRFVAETIGDDTPETALQSYERARQQLLRHLRNPDLDPALRQQILQALHYHDDE